MIVTEWSFYPMFCWFYRHKKKASVPSQFWRGEPPRPLALGMGAQWGQPPERRSSNKETSTEPKGLATWQLG